MVVYDSEYKKSVVLITLFTGSSMKQCLYFAANYFEFVFYASLVLPMSVEYVASYWNARLSAEMTVSIEGYGTS